MSVEFIRAATFGQGSFGNECALCGETDYFTGSGKIAHKDGCLLVAVVREVAKTIRDLQSTVEDWHPNDYAAFIEETYGVHE